MGVESNDDENAVRSIPRLHCNGCTANRTPIANREGIKNCYVKLPMPAARPVQLRLLRDGACVDACNFGALKIGENGLPEFDYNKCVSCGACSKACPQLLIEMIPADKKVLVQCNNREKGKAAMTDCKVSCISCGICVKTCPKQAITLEDTPNGSIPVIDYDKCVGCGLCTMKCPRKCLVKINPVTAPRKLLPNRNPPVAPAAPWPISALPPRPKSRNKSRIP